MRRFLVLLVLLLAGCTTERPAADSAAEPAATTTTVPREPQTKEAAQAAARSTEAYAAGDWAGAWDEWTPQAKRAFSRSDYVALHERCKTITGIPFKIRAVRVEGDMATVRVERASFLFAYTLRYIDGRWYFQPDPEDGADYALGLDQFLRKRHAEGSCL